MECNKDEALRAKSIAEGKLENKDFAGAKKFALKAQSLYSVLDGISQLLATIEVYISAENKISGEVDWYAVLSVNPSADDETIKKQYRKLALMLHPDKNKSAGAEGAFKLISEAHNLLSDRDKRLAYNQRRSFMGFQHRVPIPTARPSAPFRTNGFYNFTSGTTSAPKSQDNSAKPPSTSKPSVPKNPKNSAKAPSTSSTSAPKTQNNAEVPKTSRKRRGRPDSFWTTCNQCKMHFEYQMMYLNSTLRCHNCQAAFVAVEKAPPSSVTNQNTQQSSVNNQNTQQSSVNNQNTQQQRQPVSSSHSSAQNAGNEGRNSPATETAHLGQAVSGSEKSATNQQVPLAGKPSRFSTAPAVATKSASVVMGEKDKSKRYTESQSSAGREESSKKRKVDDDRSQQGMNYKTTHGNGCAFEAASSGAPGLRFYGFPGIYQQPNNTRNFGPAESRNMLVAMAKKEIKLHMPKATGKPVIKEEETTYGSKNDDLSAGNAAKRVKKSQVSGVAGREDTTLRSMSVPDPDFHDFDRDRTEGAFEDNEVWSAYDDDDGMPRFYALVSKVISRKPFKLKVSWLNSKTNGEFSSMDWVSSGFYKTCGEFRVGKYEICKSINSFSQKVNWSKSPRGSVVIIPQKDNVWALYKNWSSDWDTHTSDGVIHKYDMVTVLDDYNDECGVSVAPLVKVAGFKTVFRTNMDPQMIKRIPKEEMFRFSHRVPHYVLTGQEAENAPKGCLELDPAATPLELLQVITEASHEVPAIPHTENIDNGTNEAQTVDDAKNSLNN